MSTTMAETIKVVSDAGSLGVLVLVLAGLGYLALKAVPAAVAFMTSLTSKLGDVTTKQAVTETKLDALAASTAAMNAAIVRLGEISQGAITKAGDAAAGALGTLGSVVQEEARETREALYAAERRLTGTVLREQVSDPPPPPSRPSFSATPANGMSRTVRAGEPR